MNSKNIKILILTLVLTFTLPIVTKVKADTFTWMDRATFDQGGAGFDNAWKHTYTINPDKSYYDLNDTINVVVTDFPSYDYPTQLYNSPKMLEGGAIGDPSVRPYPYILTNSDNILLDSNKFKVNYSDIYTLFVDPIDTGALSDSNYYNYQFNPKGVYVVNYDGTYNVSGSNDILVPYVFLEVRNNVGTSTSPSISPSIFVR